MCKWLAGWLSWAANRLYPPYPKRMRRTVAAHIQTGEPELTDTCPRCSSDRYTLPLAAILDTGVMPVGSVTVCPECDTARDVVRNFRESEDGTTDA